jgi:integrase
MAAVSFLLNKPERVSGRSLIYLQFKYNGQKFVFSTGQNINPKNWDKKRQRVKSNTDTTKEGQHSLNDLLHHLEQTLLTVYRREISKGVIPTKSVLKESLLQSVRPTGNNQQTFYGLLERFINGEIKHRGQEKSPNTIKTYKTLHGHLQQFERAKKWPIHFDNIHLEFLYKYITFLRSTLMLKQNSIAKDVQILKTVMKKAVALKMTTNISFQEEDFTASREDTDAVYLTDKEIQKLYRFDFSSNSRLEQIRDLFVFGCYVGLRYSDYSTVRPEHIVDIETENGSKEYFIKRITTKTKELVIIPCYPVVLQIFDKYKDNPNRLPKALSTQKFNVGIKQVCKIAGFTEAGRLATKPKLQLYESISSHTARRSFATNLYLEGFPVIDLMKITGHRTEKAFMRYIKVTKLDAAKRLKKHYEKQWDNKLMRVA